MEKQVDSVSDIEGFDHRVEIRDPKTGKISKHQPYILRINKDGMIYERPPGSGKFFNPKGELIKDVSAEIKPKLERQPDSVPEQKPDPAPKPSDSEDAPAAQIDPLLASAEAEAEKILAGDRNTVRKRA